MNTMKTFQLGAPPPHAGVYLIRHIPTQKIYFGKTVNLKRRYMEWRTGAATGSKFGSIRLRDMMLATPLDEWEFCVLKELPDSTDSELRSYELRAIEAASARCSERLLNTIGTGEYPVEGYRKSKITYKGKPVLQTEAAKFLGVSPKSLAKRMAKRRAKGEYETRLETLMELSNLYREQQKHFPKNTGREIPK